MSRRKRKRALSAVSAALKETISLTKKSQLGAALAALAQVPFSGTSVKAAPPSQKKKNKQSGAAKPHITTAEESCAVLAKGGSYAKAGADFIEANNGRGVYNVFTHLLGISWLDEGEAAKIETASRFPGGIKENFNKPEAGQKRPYAWEAHHLVPGSAFYLEMDPGGPVFTQNQYEILLRSDYNINNGHNIIMLPDGSMPSAVIVHALPLHPSDHRGYTKLVMQCMKNISDRISQLEAQEKKHAEIAVSFAKELDNLEEDLWEFVVSSGRWGVKAMTSRWDSANIPKLV